MQAESATALTDQWHDSHQVSHPQEAGTAEHDSLRSNTDGDYAFPLCDAAAAAVADVQGVLQWPTVEAAVALQHCSIAAVTAVEAAELA